MGHISVLTEMSRPRAEALVVDGFVSLISVLDKNVAVLLLTIAELSDGADFLIERGILNAIRTAAEKYIEVESALIASSATSVVYQPTKVTMPSFFLGHIRLLSSPDLQGEHSRRSGDEIDLVSRIIHLYSPLIERLIAKFPQEGDVLQEVITCIAQVNR